MEEVIREGRWKCPGCGNSNRGRDVKCQGCGQARENVEFEYDESAAEVTDAADLAVATGGADWVCPYCSTSNRAANASCKQCGAASAEGKKRETGELARPAPALAHAAESAPSGMGILGRLILGGMACFAALFLWLVVQSIRTHEEKLTVASAHWTRNITVEHFIPVQEDGWDVPSGGRVLSSREEIHHHDRVASGTRQVQRSYTERVASGTKRVKTGTQKMGNGFFKDTYENQTVYRDVTRTRTETETVYRNVPIFRRKYLYEIERWKPAREVPTSGDDTAPLWGDAKLAGPKEREGPRTETCEVVFESNGKRYPWKPPVTDFTRLKVGSAFKMEVNGLDEVKKLLE